MKNKKKKGFISKVSTFVKAHKLLVIIVPIVFICGIASGVIIASNKGTNGEQNKCIVQFETNGGTAIEDKEIKCGKTVDAPSAPSKEGFVFDYWEYEGKEFDFKTSIKESIIISAKYHANDNIETVTITFDTNGGSKIEDIVIVKGGTLTKPVNPTKSGYKFSGWYKDYVEFDFSSAISENITLKAKWDENRPNNSNGNSNSNVNTNSSSGDYNCHASFREDVPEKKVFVGYNDHVNWTWSTYGSYGGGGENPCYLTYKTSDSNIATVSNAGVITTKKEGTVYISECVNDTKTKKELICFKGKLIIEEKKCEYSTDSRTYQMNNQPWDIEVGTSLSFPLKTYFSYTIDGCSIKYKTSDSNVATVSSDGTIVGKSKGVSTITSCIVNDATQKELDCISMKANVKLPANLEYVDDNLFKNLQGTWYMNDQGTSIYVKFTEGTRNGERVLWYEENGFCSSTGTPNPTTCGGTSYFSYDFLTNPSIGVNAYGWSYSGGYLYNSSGSSRIKFSKTPTYAAVSSVSINKTSDNMYIGDTSSLEAIIKPSNAGNKAVTWSSSDSSVVTINNSGLVKAISAGTAVITVTTADGNKTATCTITVTSRSVDGVTLNKTSLALVRGKSETLTATIIPNNATNKNVSWSTSDASVATVTNGRVTAVGKGNAIITVTTEDGNKSATCDVSVTIPPLTATASIGISYVSSSTGTSRGVVVEVSPSGGTGKYTYYDIKLYKDNVLVGETINPNINSIYIVGLTNGSYRADFEVRDSDGTSFTGSTNSTISGF